MWRDRGKGLYAAFLCDFRLSSRGHYLLDVEEMAGIGSIGSYGIGGFTPVTADTVIRTGYRQKMSDYDRQRAEQLLARHQERLKEEAPEAIQEVIQVSEVVEPIQVYQVDHSAILEKIQQEIQHELWLEEQAKLDRKRKQQAQAFMLLM